MSHIRMSTDGSKESFDNIQLVYWLWLKLYETGILNIIDFRAKLVVFRVENSNIQSEISH